ncbi:MAG: hypothetical protein IJ087_11965 [Eggerthellaceae bacterium]|nr:hypothetical protein [Eggerthellaceae bacterium]
MEATKNIAPSPSRFEIDEVSKENILSAPIRAQQFQKSEAFVDLKEDLVGRTARVRDAICIAALIDNVNLRGRVIEELVTTDDPQIILSAILSYRQSFFRALWAL